MCKSKVLQINSGIDLHFGDKGSKLIQYYTTLRQFESWNMKHKTTITIVTRVIDLLSLKKLNLK